MNEDTNTRDRYERAAVQIWKRWYRAAHYAMKTTAVDAVLRFRLRDHHEAWDAVRDVLAGREGLANMLRRARRAARLRLRRKVEDVVLRVAFSMPAGAGRCTLARAVRRAGYAVSPSTVRRMLERRGAWRPRA